MQFDVIVIGGGPAGMMAAIQAAQVGAKTLLLEKGSSLGRKLLITGGGRCNVTTSNSPEEVIKHVPGNGRFLHSALSEFNNQDIIQFFSKAGVSLKEEAHGRMFPEDDQSITILNGLIRMLKKNKVTVATNANVANIHYKDDQVHCVELKSGEKIYSSSIIIAVGGQTMPKTGSTGDGYAWAKNAGHTIMPLFPTEVPLVSRDSFITNGSLQGLSFQDVELSVLNKKGKRVVTHRHDLLFTHFGISGPAALRASQFVRKVKEKDTSPSVTVTLDVLPNEHVENLFTWLTKAKHQEPLKLSKTILKSKVQERYGQFLLSQMAIPEDVTIGNLKNEQIRGIANLLKEFPVQICDTLGFEKAFVTGGGVSIKEVNPKTMESKKKKGLFFCGEILDIHAYTGGYNITAAMVTGYSAGRNAAHKELNL